MPDPIPPHPAPAGPSGPSAPAAPDPDPSLVEDWATAWASRPRLRGWQHVAAILPAIGAGVALTARAQSRRERIAAAAWGVGMVGMLTSSASYHRLPRRERTAKVLRRLDHAAIWGAVAGTWTPVALAVLPGAPGVALAGGMWGTAVTAAAAKTAAFDRVDPKVNVLYVVMGWVGLAILPRTVRQLGPRATAFLIAGGTAYTVGAIGYATKRPNLVPGVYGYHEAWHSATLAGAGLHAVTVKAALDVIRAQDAAD